MTEVSAGALAEGTEGLKLQGLNQLPEGNHEATYNSVADPFMIVEPLGEAMSHIMEAQALEQCFLDNGKAMGEMNNELDKDELEQGAIFTMNLLASLKHVNQNKMNLHERVHPSAHNNSLFSNRTSGYHSKPGQKLGLLHGRHTANPVFPHRYQQKLLQQQLGKIQQPLQDPISHQQPHMRSATESMAPLLVPPSQNRASSPPQPPSLALKPNTPWPLAQDSAEACAATPETTETNVIPPPKRHKRGRPKKNKLQAVNVPPSTKLPLELESLGTILATNESLTDPLVAIQPPSEVMAYKMFESAAKALELSLLDNGKTIAEILNELENGPQTMDSLQSNLHDSFYASISHTIPSRSTMVANKQLIHLHMTEPCGDDLNVQGSSYSQLPSQPSLMKTSTAAFTDESQVSSTPDLVDRLRENLPEVIPRCSCPVGKFL